MSSQVTVGLVTDSTADIPAEVIRALEIENIPALLIIDGETFEDGKQLSRTDFYRGLPDYRQPPTTATPSPAQFNAAYQRLLDRGMTHDSTIRGPNATTGDHDFKSGKPFDFIAYFYGIRDDAKPRMSRKRPGNGTRCSTGVDHHGDIVGYHRSTCRTDAGFLFLGDGLAGFQPGIFGARQKRGATMKPHNAVHPGQFCQIPPNGLRCHIEIGSNSLNRRAPFLRQQLDDGFAAPRGIHGGLPFVFQQNEKKPHWQTGTRRKNRALGWKSLSPLATASSRVSGSWWAVAARLPGRLRLPGR